MVKSIFSLVFVAWLLFLLPLGAKAQTFHTVRGLLGDQFKGSEHVSYERITVTGEAKRHIEAQLGKKLEKDRFTFYIAKTGDRIDGYALFDEELGQHEKISFATFFDAEGRVTRVEVVAYREPYGDGIRAERFRRQFVGRTATSGYRVGRDIDVVSGSTISSRSLSKGVQRASVLLRELVLKQKTTVASATVSG